MTLASFRCMAGFGAALLAGTPALAQQLTVDEFRRELVGVPLCGTPPDGPLAGKALCTVHLPDGTAVLAGSGILARGIWEADNGQICRLTAHDAPERRHCIVYERAGPNRFRNSDGVEVCLGPCPEPAAPGSGAGVLPAPSPTEK